MKTTSTSDPKKCMICGEIIFSEYYKRTSYCGTVCAISAIPNYYGYLFMVLILGCVVITSAAGVAFIFLPAAVIMLFLTFVGHKKMKKR